MSSGIHPILLHTVCVRDDDHRTFCFLASANATQTTGRVAAALAGGRRLRCYTLSADRRAEERERRFLVAKGYRETAVEL